MKPRTSLPIGMGHDFSRATALALGATDGRLRGSDLVAPFHGVRSRSEPHTLEARCRAFMLRMPETGFFNSLTAAGIMSLPVPQAMVRTELHVAVPAPTRGLKAAGVIGHKVQLMGGDSRLWHGLPVSSPERAFCEIAALLSVADLVAVGDHIIHWRSPLVSHSTLQNAVARYPGQRGRGRLLRAVGLLDERAESPQESRLRVLLADGKLVGFVANYEVEVRGRRFRIDLAFPDLKIAVEYQGDHHRSAHQWRKDMTRKSILASVGWLVIEINTDDMRDPAELVSRIRHALATRRGGPNRSS